MLDDLYLWQRPALWASAAGIRIYAIVTSGSQGRLVDFLHIFMALMGDYSDFGLYGVINLGSRYCVSLLLYYRSDDGVIGRVGGSAVTQDLFTVEIFDDEG